MGADCSELAPALYEADAHYLIPRMKDPGYFDAVFAICEKEKINVVLPLQEDELNLIAETGGDLRTGGSWRLFRPWRF